MEVVVVSFRGGDRVVSFIEVEFVGGEIEEFVDPELS